MPLIWPYNALWVEVNPGKPKVGFWDINTRRWIGCDKGRDRPLGSRLVPTGGRIGFLLLGNRCSIHLSHRALCDLIPRGTVDL